MRGCGTFMDLPHLPEKPFPDNVVAFGKELRELRLKYDISMGEFARLVKANLPSVSAVEIGRFTDPDFTWCDKCEKTDKKSRKPWWRDCQACGGKGYVRREER